MMRHVVTAVVAVLAWCGTAATACADWLEQVRTDRPRMFFNRETWPQVKAYTLEHEKAYYEQLKARVAGFPVQPDATFEQGANPKYGPYAKMAAFVWLMEGDRDALQKARNYIMAAPDFYHRQIDAGRAVNWYSASRVCLLSAYDWIHDQLTPEEREQFAKRFIDHHTREFAPGAKLQRLNASGRNTGFYGPTNLPWYIGLAFLGDSGVADDYCREMLRKGYQQHIDLIEYRAESAGDDGGMSSVANGYAFGMYPFTEFNFMRTFASATGIAMAERYDHLSLLPNWVAWNAIPQPDGTKSFGLGDVSRGNDHRFEEGQLSMHMLQVADFYASKYPDRARLAVWVRENLLRNRQHDAYWWPIAPLLVTRTAELPEPAGPDASWPKARHFQAKGAIFMRSGWGPDDTHAVFVAGGVANQHRHYDQGHFIIHHRGRLALDGGTYAGITSANPHLLEYFYRTVAHNSILIHAPKEADEAPRVWGVPAKTLDGGQSRFGGKVLAFETNDQYTYAVTDMTGAYHPGKAAEVVRQFLFVYPDLFVVFDRVQSTKAEYAKAWLVQTARKPDLLDDGRTFRTTQAQGVLMTRTIFPADAKLELVGGAGKQFWSANQNWEPPTKDAFSELWGEYRVEVQPGAARERDVFLHVIRVGDSSLTSLGQVEAIEEAGQRGVRLTRDGKAIEVRFAETGDVGGQIRIDDVQRPLAQRVQEQVGLATDD